MGLGGVELVMAAEEALGVELSAADVERVELTLREIIAETLGVSDFKPDDRFVEELGLD